MKRETLTASIFHRLPAFIRTDYPDFARFIDDYYKWSENDGNFQRILTDWETNMEPTNGIEPFVDAILLDSGFDIELEGDNSIQDEEARRKDLTKKKSNLIHLIKEFYLARGSKQSFDFLFRILFDDKATIVYPREKMLVPSNSTYGTLFKTFASADSLNAVDSKRVLDRILENSRDTAGIITGILSGETATIERITRVLSDGRVFLEIETLEPSGPFFVNESVRIQVGDDFVFETIQTVFDIEVEDGGFDYRVGDPVYITGTGIVGSAFVAATSGGEIENINIIDGGSGYVVGDVIIAKPTEEGSGFSAVVSSVDTNGAITSTRIVNKGYGYRIIPEIYIANRKGSDTSPTDAILVPVSQTIGSIRRVSLVSPYARKVGVNTATVESLTGSGADLSTIETTVFRKDGWEDRLGFLGERCTLIDSDKYQQFSYEVVSPVDPSRYNPVVDDLLHPVGYIRASVVELQSHVNIGLFE